MGERLHGMQEVIGSSPLSSTRNANLFCKFEQLKSIWPEEFSGLLLLKFQLWNLQPVILKTIESLIRLREKFDWPLLSL